MSIFRPGLRVRILFSVSFPELAGEQGTIVEAADPDDACGLSGPFWLVEPDCWGGIECPYDSESECTSFAPAERQLEPIQPAGYAVSSWDKCVWRPGAQKPRRKKRVTRREEVPA